MDLQPMLVTPIAALAVGLIAVRAIRRLPLSIGFVDSPDRRRKLHDGPIALGGGVAVWLTTWCAWGGGMGLHPTALADATDSLRFFGSLAVSSFLVLLLGIVDDRFGMRAVHKLAGQILVAVILVVAGVRIDAVYGFGFVIELGDFSYIISVCWIVLIINAFNLIDGMDGFCGGVAFVTAVGLAVMAFRAGHAADALIGLALAGSLAAFLRDNIPPARIYLGDAGSMTLGLMFAALSVRACSGATGAPVALLPLIALLTLPLLDVATALARRGLAGHPLFMADRGHIHHRLHVRLGGTVAAMGVAVALATLGAAGAIFARHPDPSDGMALLAIVAPLVLLVATGTFGGSELRLVLFRIRQTSARFVGGSTMAGRTIPQECRLNGGRNWAEVWDALMDSAEGSSVRRIELAIDMPAAGETYHGFWSGVVPVSTGPVAEWSIVHAIQVRGSHAGELRVSGRVDVASTRYLDKVEELVRILEGHLAVDSPAQVAVTPTRLVSSGVGRFVWQGTEG